MQEYYVEVHVDIAVTEDCVRDIMSLALKGIDSWGRLDTAREEYLGGEPAAEVAAKFLLNRCGITIVDKRAVGRAYTIFMASLLRGIQMFIEEEDNGGAYLDDGKFMAECLDEYSASYIIQYAIFGAIEYIE